MSALTQQREKFDSACKAIEPDIWEMPGMRFCSTERLNSQSLRIFAFAIREIGNLPLIAHDLSYAGEDRTHSACYRKCRDWDTNLLKGSLLLLMHYRSAKNKVAEELHSLSSFCRW